jgi:uncharacterized protein
MTVTLDQLRRFAVARTLFPPLSLQGALDRFGFVQADPIRAPARAQDLTLRHRVRGYRAGDLERRYAALDVEEDFFVNYGFLARRVHGLMHPRSGWGRLPGSPKRIAALLAFVRERGEAHPRDVQDYFAHGKVTNYWGGSSNATTHTLDAMHYRGLLRVVRREQGIRVYGLGAPAEAAASRTERHARLDALVDVLVRKYAPLTRTGLTVVSRRLRYAVPQWQHEIGQAIERATKRLAHVRLDGVDWYWPADERPADAAVDDRVRLLTPFDPIVWDRRRFAQLWDWEYRFEAYTPAAKRLRGYYALPVAWRNRIVGWANLAVRDGMLESDVGFATRAPRERTFREELAAELDRMRQFLGL